MKQVMRKSGMISAMFQKSIAFTNFSDDGRIECLTRFSSKVERSSISSVSLSNTDSIKIWMAMCFTRK